MPGAILLISRVRHPIFIHLFSLGFEYAMLARCTSGKKRTSIANLIELNVIFSNENHFEGVLNQIYLVI